GVVLAQHLDGQLAAQVAVAAAVDDADAAAAHLAHQLVAVGGVRLGSRLAEAVRRPPAGPGRVLGATVARRQPRAVRGRAHLPADDVDQVGVAGEAQEVVAGPRLLARPAAV